MMSLIPESCVRNVVAPNDSSANSELKCYSLMISVQQEIIATLNRSSCFFVDLKEARATCCKLHTRGRKVLERLSPWNCPGRPEPSAGNLGSAAYTEVARLRLWPESRIWGRKDALHSKTRHSIVVMKVTAVVPTGLQCAVEIQTQQMSDAKRSPRTLAASSLAAVVRARLLL